MSQIPPSQDDFQKVNDIPNEEKLKNIILSHENLENIYNILKGEDIQLKKDTLKQLIQDFEGVEYDEMQNENENPNTNISNHNPFKLGIAVKEKESRIPISENNIKTHDNNNFIGTSGLIGQLKTKDYISFEEFCNIFKKIFEVCPNLDKIFLEGFCYMDKNK